MMSCSSGRGTPVKPILLPSHQVSQLTTYQLPDVTQPLASLFGPTHVVFPHIPGSLSWTLVYSQPIK